MSEKTKPTKPTPSNRLPPDHRFIDSGPSVKYVRVIERADDSDVEEDTEDPDQLLRALRAGMRRLRAGLE